MKHQYPWKFRLVRWGIEWYQTEATLGTDHYFNYFYVHRMNKKMRDAWRKRPYGQRVLGTDLFGLHKYWYDCPHAQLNMYFIVLSWSTQWTTMPKDYWNESN